LFVVAGIGTLTGAAFIFATPSSAVADTRGQVAAAMPEKIHITLHRLHQITGASCAVLHLYEPDDRDPFTEMMLWIADTDGSGSPEPSEIGVLSHNSVLDSIVWYPPRGGHHATDILDQVAARELCRSRRKASPAQYQVFAQAISDLGLNWCNPLESGDELLEITLTWPSKGADGLRRAFKHVHVRRIQSVDWSD
jgi:hypothetical protein